MSNYKKTVIKKERALNFQLLSECLSHPKRTRRPLCLFNTVHTLTAAPLVGSVGAVLVSVTLQSLREALTHVPTRKLTEGAIRLYVCPVGQQH